MSDKSSDIITIHVDRSSWSQIEDDLGNQYGADLSEVEVGEQLIVSEVTPADLFLLAEVAVDWAGEYGFTNQEKAAAIHAAYDRLKEGLR